MKSGRSLLAVLVGLVALALPSAASAQGATVFADISVAQTDRLDPAIALQELAYDVTVSNGGPGVALIGVTIDTPFGSDIVRVDDPDCEISADGQVVCLALPSLLPDGTYEVSVVTRPRQLGTITNTVSATPLLPALDPDISNNVSEETTDVLPQKFTRGCRGGRPTIVGETGGGVIRGTPGDDVIVGLDGDDVIRGGRGNDRICGQGGDDVIKGGAGNDKLKGGAGDDQLTGGAGKDKLAGTAGNDVLSGGAGDDRLRASAGDDRVKGGPGDDRANGGAGNDVLSGAGGDDRLFGHGGDDELSGRSGDDLLQGGGGLNLLEGGSGSDRCRGNGTAERCERR